MVAQTFVSLHRYGYGTVLATLQKIFTTDGRRPRSTTRFYNWFGVDSMSMPTEGMEVQLCQRYEGQLNHMTESTPPPSGPFPRTPSRRSSLLHGRAKTDSLDWLARTPLAHHFDFVWVQGSAQWCRSYLELDDNRKNMILFGDATESY